MASKGNLLGTEKPHLDISAFDDDNKFFQKYKQLNGDIFAEKQHLAMPDELAAKCNFECIAGAAQATIEAAKRVLPIPGSVSLMGYVREDRSGKEHEKNTIATCVNDEPSNLISWKSSYCFKPICYSFRHIGYDDETTVIGICKVDIFDNEGSFVANLPAENNHKTNLQRKPKIWENGLTDAFLGSSHQRALQQLPSKTDLHEKDNESMKRFLSGRGSSFHGSHAVSESLKGGAHDLSPCSSSPNEVSSKKPFSHQIIAVGVTTAVLFFPIAAFPISAKFSKTLCT
ncbi:adenosine kinase 2-like [Phalaenopsis equestris]|uniref:adenosine kinase 2-like n=1 Tax=Phalaenopsis equestris TaxID=78828 RepID=UPI0009E2208A|nr:adenosine kinase 2-like [Phalaenopsis equestris]